MKPSTASLPGEWKRGWPPGKYYVGMTEDYEVYFAPMGWIWHRRIR